MPAGAVVLLGVLLAVGAYAGWYRLSGEGRLPAETSTQVPLRLAPLAEQAVQRPAASASRCRRAGAGRTAVGAAGRGAAGSGDFAEFSGRRGRAVAVPPVPGGQSDQSRILLRASADAWVQVRDRAGPVLLTRTLHPGETWEVPAKPNLLLTTGTPAAPILWWMAWPARRWAAAARCGATCRWTRT